VGEVRIVVAVEVILKWKEVWEASLVNEEDDGSGVHCIIAIVC
jgi:hypothetical protein